MHLRRNGALVLLCVVGLVTAYGCAPDNEDSAFPPVDVDAEAGPGDPNQFGTPDGMVLPEAGPAKPTCGNSAKDTGETCDDGNGVAGDGCSATCQIEPGWKCDTIGARVRRDGVRRRRRRRHRGLRRRQHREPPTAAARSASSRPASSARCPGKACTPTVCGDGDDGGHRAVRRRQRASVRRLLASTARSSRTARRARAPRSAATASSSPARPATTATRGAATAAARRARSSRASRARSSRRTSRRRSTCRSSSRLPGRPPATSRRSTAACRRTWSPPTLAADGTPRPQRGTHPPMTSDASFFDWYHDGAGTKTVISTLTMPKLPNDSYEYANTSFFPLDGLGWGNTAGQSPQLPLHERGSLLVRVQGRRGRSTSRGDDDVWVFVNRQARRRPRRRPRRAERQRHARRGDGDARSGSSVGEHLRDRRLPGRAPHDAVELQADARRLRRRLARRASRSAATASRRRTRRATTARTPAATASAARAACSAPAAATPSCKRQKASSATTATSSPATAAPRSARPTWPSRSDEHELQSLHAFRVIPAFHWVLRWAR